ncbi:hypothetical protein EDC01DRAFT_788151 [Geopyxis carbonaria]|nr:hypothetical protein EDC01DRAFT_788151 [Geopyxis carbonaria]
MSTPDSTPAPMREVPADLDRTLPPDPNTLDLSSTSTAPLYLHGGKTPVLPLTGFYKPYAALIQAGGPPEYSPWIPRSRSAFAPNQPAILDRSGGGSGGGNYREAITSSSSFSSEHLSTSGSVSVGGSFLGASVSVDYDKYVQHDGSAYKASRHSLVTGPRILVGAPKLNADAISLLRDEGPVAFHQKFGNYYVAVLQTGGESGMMMTQDKSHSLETERLTITVTVKVLFTSHSVSWTKETRDELASVSATIVGYDSVAGVEPVLLSASATSSSVGADLRDGLEFERTVNKHKENSESLGERLLEALGDIIKVDLSGKTVVGEEEMVVTEEMLNKMMTRGLVTEVVLQPFSGLWEYRQALALGPQSKRLRPWGFVCVKSYDRNGEEVQAGYGADPAMSRTTKKNDNTQHKIVLRQAQQERQRATSGPVSDSDSDSGADWDAAAKRAARKMMAHAAANMSRRAGRSAGGACGAGAGRR